MNTKTLVQTSANVVRINNISAGNLYKRFDLESSYDSDKTIFGIVNAIHNDGENTIIEATEYKTSYSGIEVSNKNITSKKDVVMFPCTLEEFNLEFGKAKKRMLKDIEEYQEKIEDKQKQINNLDLLISGEKQKTLSVASYKEMTQEQYKNALAQLN
jgi:hypothetical protein